MGIKVLNKDCIDMMREMKSGSVNLIIADPPYFSTNRKDVGDNQWRTSDEYIEWLVLLLNEFNRILTPNGSLYLYHNNHIIITKVLSLITDDLYFRNHIVWDKSDVLDNFSRVVKTYGSNRKYDGTFREDIYYFTKQRDYFNTPFSRIIKYYITEGGFTQKEASLTCLSRNGNPTGWLSNKIKGTQNPTRKQWSGLCDLFDIEDNYDDLLKQFEEERFNFNQEYIDFKGMDLQKQKEVLAPYSNIWSFNFGEDEDLNFPTQKPKEMTANIVKISSNPGDKVYIPFGGSGNEGIVAHDLNRGAIMSEINKEYYDDILEKIKLLQYKGDVDVY